MRSVLLNSGAGKERDAAGATVEKNPEKAAGLGELLRDELALHPKRDSLALLFPDESVSKIALCRFAHAPVNSTPISSAQTGVHEQLAELVARHAAHPFRKPVTDYNRRAFDDSMAAWHAAGDAPLILDTGCGVGLSTLNLATQYPDHFVIGIDQSADRLARNTLWDGPAPGNLCFVRADLVDYWRLAFEAGLRPARHYLLYPNPWPKIGHLARRWQGHAVFPAIVSLGGQIECRSNWRIYVEEFAAALGQLSGLEVAAERYTTDDPITPFERKYLASGHELWRCRADLDQAPWGKPR